MDSEEGDKYGKLFLFPEILRSTANYASILCYPPKTLCDLQFLSHLYLLDFSSNFLKTMAIKS